MSKVPHIALLPGLDGTGKLFFPIIPYLEKHFEVHIVRYSNELTFKEYVKSAESQLSEFAPISLVAESFSGPIALALLANKNVECIAAVLSTTFCKTPLPLLTQLSNYIPEKIFSSNAISKIGFDFFGTNSKVSVDVKKKMHQVLETVTPKQFKNRVRVINELDITEKLNEIETPILYIRATNDRIVFPKSGNEIKNYLKTMEIKEVDGPHMILQSRPKICSDLILSHVISNTHMQKDVHLGKL